MIGIYFSGTGNTRYAVEEFLKAYEGEARMYAIEDANWKKEILTEDEILFAYPVYFSNLPKIVKDCIVDNRTLWQGKKLYIMITMGLFSGDGTGCSARLFKKCGGKIMGGLHLKMPDAIADEKLLKKSLPENQKIVEASIQKVMREADNLKRGKPCQEGLSFISHVRGLLGQRLWFFQKTKYYSSKLKIDREKCIGCETCVKLCPMKNIILKEKKAVAGNRCTMCYRCISHCPKSAITLLGKEVVEQSRIENYIKH